MKYAIKALCYITILAIFIATFSVTIVASTLLEINENEEQQIFSTATINDSFADDRVIVVFKNKESLQFKDYTTKDFSEINCRGINILAENTYNKAKNTMNDIQTALAIGQTIAIDKEINFNKYNTMVCLTLEETGKDKVLDGKH